MARPGLEPGTPRFSVVGPKTSNWVETAANQPVHGSRRSPGDSRKLRFFCCRIGHSTWLRCLITSRASPGPLWGPGGWRSALRECARRSPSCTSPFLTARHPTSYRPEAGWRLRQAAYGRSPATGPSAALPAARGARRAQHGVACTRAAARLTRPAASAVKAALEQPRRRGRGPVCASRVGHARRARPRPRRAPRRPAAR